MNDIEFHVHGEDTQIVRFDEVEDAHLVGMMKLIHAINNTPCEGAAPGVSIQMGWEVT